jgi:hypothetical protein
LGFGAKFGFPFGFQDRARELGGMGINRRPETAKIAEADYCALFFAFSAAFLCDLGGLRFFSTQPEHAQL